MKPADFQRCLDRIHKIANRLAHPFKIMEVCGTHTVTACRSGLRTLLPPNVRLLSGPGCPVCVTPERYIDRAIQISRLPDASIATFGDLMRVPGTLGTLEREKAKGARVRVVYSVLEALALAGELADKKIVFLAVGFETTAPGIAWAVQKAAENNLHNFSILGALKTMPFAMRALLKGGVQIDGFMCPGHVSSIIGIKPYEFMAVKYGVPCVIAGFEPYDMALAIEMLLTQIAAGKHVVQNEYRRAVCEDGNLKAQELIKKIFAPIDAEWRGLGIVPGSGLKLKSRFKHFDAEVLFPGLRLPENVGKTKCLCGEVLRGRILPPECPLYGRECTPVTPVGACMVSGEGACAAYFKYSRSAAAANK